MPCGDSCKPALLTCKERYLLAVYLDLKKKKFHRSSIKKEIAAQKCIGTPHINVII
jgi:hypothetical protein